MYRIWRRWLSLLTALALALVFCFAACPFAAFADDTGQKVYQDMIYYTITPMHEVTITGARAILTEANIPAELDGCPVTEIERYAFKDCTRLERISIPDTVSDIGWGIVQGTPWLDNQTEEFVIAGKGFLLAYTGADATVTIPDTVSTIGGYAFEGCTSLVSVKVEDGITSIPVRAFSGCTALTDLSLPSSLKKIDEYAFAYCTSLKEVYIGGAVELAEGAFYACSAELTLFAPSGSGAEKYSARYGIKFSAD